MTEPETLSDREMEVLRLVARGLTNDQIARDLVISTNTVKVHLRNIFAKLGVASRTEASLHAVRHGWVVLESPTPAAAETAPPSEEAAALPAEGVPQKPAVSHLSRWLLAASVLILIASLAISFGAPLLLPRPTPSPVVETVTVAERWQTRAPLPTAHSGMAVAPFQGTLYACGGRTAAGTSSATLGFDPLADTWTRLADKPTAVADVQAAVAAGHIYLPGGRDSQGRLTSQTEVYLVERNQWTSAAGLPWALSAYALVSFEGKLFLLGGWDGTQYRDEVIRYSPETDKWQVVARLPFPCGYASALVVDNHILLIGGVNDDGPLGVIVDYYPALATMAPQPLTAVSLGRVQATLLREDYIYILAQQEETSPPQLWQHNLKTAVWQTIPTSQAGLPGGGALAGLGDYLYLVGGQDGGTPLDLVQEFRAVYVTAPLPAVKP
jgi:DNA-binding CsgD family transcriptional regulator